MIAVFLRVAVPLAPFALYYFFFFFLLKEVQFLLLSSLVDLCYKFVCY